MVFEIFVVVALVAIFLTLVILAGLSLPVFTSGLAEIHKHLDVMHEYIVRINQNLRG